jgi:hypothetical protein
MDFVQKIGTKVHDRLSTHHHLTVACSEAEPGFRPRMPPRCEAVSNLLRQQKFMDKKLRMGAVKSEAAMIYAAYVKERR